MTLGEVGDRLTRDEIAREIGGRVGPACVCTRAELAAFRGCVCRFTASAGEEPVADRTRERRR